MNARPKATPFSDRKFGVVIRFVRGNPTHPIVEVISVKDGKSRVRCWEHGLDRFGQPRTVDSALIMPPPDKEDRRWGPIRMSIKAERAAVRQIDAADRKDAEKKKRAKARRTLIASKIRSAVRLLEGAGYKVEAPVKQGA